jgi:polynucleotide 5'-kinase involved in rRNA processing
MDGAVETLAKAVLPVLKGRDDLNEAKVGEIIKALLETPKDLIMDSDRVLTMKDEMSAEALALVFNMEHHIVAATSFFNKYCGFKRNTRAVVFGHKNQGKTQFLFFLTKLLQALGEGVVYLDLQASLEK